MESHNQRGSNNVENMKGAMTFVAILRERREKYLNYKIIR